MGERGQLLAQLGHPEGPTDCLQVRLLQPGGATSQVEVGLVGELCTGTAAAALAPLSELAEHPGGHLVLDMAAVTFFDARGLSMLLALQERLRPLDVQLHLRNPSRAVQLVVEITPLRELVGEPPAARSGPRPAAPSRARRPRRRRRRGPVESYGEGRACADPGCGTVLSRYNPSDRCSEHDSPGRPSDMV